jgi:hypothetical protein
MKTIRMGTPRTRNTWTMLLMAALGGLYYHRKNGGSIRDITSTAFSKLGSLRGVIDRVAPSVAGHISSSQNDSVIGSSVGARSSSVSSYQPSTTV